MPDQLVKLSVDDTIATIALNDPAKRNALSAAMFDQLQASLRQIEPDSTIQVVLLRGEGSAFCAGFDLAAAQHDPALIGVLIQRLSETVRCLRRMPQVVVAAVHGAAIAGGCAILSGCDFVFVAADAKLGYPVHRLGISPAVTIPTLQQALAPGAARAMLMGGDLIDGVAARRIGLATHVCASDRSALQDASAFCEHMLAKGHHAVRTTKRWVNELDRSLEDAAFEGPSRASTLQSNSDESFTRLSQWRSG